MTATSVKLNSGFEMPLVGLGTWKSKKGEVGRAVTAAIEAGYRHFDCAYVYENEDEIGEAFADAFARGVVRREDLFVVSKLWMTFMRPDLVRTLCEKTIKDLQIGYLDLYLIHWPTACKEETGELWPKEADGSPAFSSVSPNDTWKAMEELVTGGLCKSIGVSNFNARQIESLLSVASIKPAVNQVESHPYLNQVKLIEFCRARDIVVTAYSPFCSPDRAWSVESDPKPLLDAAIIAIGAQYGKSAAQVLIRFQIQRGLVCIPKSTNADRLTANLSVFDFELSEADMATLNAYNNGWRCCGLSNFSKHPQFPFHDEF